MSVVSATGEQIVHRWKKGEQECRISLLPRPKDGKTLIHLRYFSVAPDGSTYPTRRGITFEPQDAAELAAGCASLATVCAGRE